MTRPSKSGTVGPTDINLDERDAATVETVLLVIGDEVRVHRLPPRGTVLVGRSTSCEVVIDEASISRRHAQLSITGDRTTIEDLGSTHGTRVAGADLAREERVALVAGQPFTLGRVTAMIQERAARSEEAPAAAATPMERAHQLIGRIASGHINVLLLGETGAGKEVTAARIHELSPRGGGPFVKLNCAALAESLLESELFGHERGAFTGAAQAKPGLLEAASGGTLFLDEIGELPPALQVKLLRAVEEGTVRRVGAIDPVPIDVRFIAATNRDLEAEVAAGRFRKDLYYRLAGASVTIPPLRHRRDEILPLAERFCQEASVSLGRAAAPKLTREARRWLTSYAWPGNVRELRNVIERAVLLAGDGDVDLEHLPAEEEAPPQKMRDEIKQEVEALERQRIVEALAECAGNQTRAAKKLGLSRRALVNRLDAYGIPRPRKKGTR